MSLQVIYNLVKDKLADENVIKIPKYSTFCAYFKRTFVNVKFKPMSTDKCNFCDDITKTEEEKTEHNRLQRAAMTQHKADQALPWTFTFDMQSTLPLP